MICPTRWASALARWVTLSAALASAGALAQPQQSLLRIRLNADMRGTDPGVNRDANTDIIMMHLIEGLVAYREDGTVGPLLAESVETSADGKTHTFKLRRGLRFHQGAPLTADDVVFAWNRYMKPENNWRCRSEFDGRGLAKVLRAEAKDALTIVYTLDRPSALFLATLARPDCGGTGIYHRSSLDAEGKWAAPVGTGPFKLGDWKRGQYIELLRNDAYSAIPGNRDGNTGNKTSMVSKVRFVVIPDASAAKAALLSGGIDIAYDVDDQDVAEYQTRKDVVVTSVPTMNLVGILFQTRDPLLKDARIRRAIALSLDLPLIVETVTSGTSKPSRSVIPLPSGYHQLAQAALPRRDLALARKMLTEAGYKGEAIKLLATKRYENVLQVAVLAQAMALEAGIKIEIEVLDWATLLDRYTKGDYQAMSFTYSSRLDPSLSYEMMSGAKDQQPRKVWDNPEALELIGQSMAAVDRSQRQAIFDVLEAKMREDVPAVFMYSGMQTAAVKGYVTGYRGWPLGLARAWGVSMHVP
jgi:peptide/nickel transport system substrate-binding protein